MFQAMRKQEAVSAACRTWCLNRKQKLGITWDKFKEELEVTREQTSEVQYGVNELAKRRQCQDKARDQLLYWKQRAKIKWDSLGDQCTSFFFRSVKTRKGRNEINLIKKEDGTWLRDEKEISNCFFESYSRLFNPEKTNQVGLDGRNDWFEDLPKLQEEDLDILLQPFNREEVRAAVEGMKPLKAPALNGFPPIFFLKHWDIVGEEIWGAVSSFFTGGRMLKEMNKTFITLFPKVERPETISDFRPISLCNTVYKIITKCMVGRLKRVLPKLVGENQNAFVPGRQLADNCLLANEMLHLLKTRKKGRKFLGILKVDLSKAYDRVRWDFLEKVLVIMNFPAVWVGWIMECVSTVKYAILVNGAPTREFTPSVGLRQGDPISPYLFILCMEALSKRMEALQRENRIKGLVVSRNRERISHLFFADDALFSFEATPESCNEVRTTLEEFCSVSGEMVNYKKSHIQFSRNTPPKFVCYMRKPLGVRSQERMGTYLGCPMEVDGRNTGTFNQIHDRVIQCISSWKYACLSPAARSILINSILVALAAHIMSVYLLPQKVLKKISSTITKFYWGGNGQAKPIYWKNRDTLELRKEEGGLGLRNLTSLNQALLFRQVWKLSKNPHALVSRVIRHKYGKDPLAFVREGKNLRNASWSMRSMVNCARSLKSGCDMRIGNGRATRIQEEIWAGKKLVTFRERANGNLAEKPKFVSDIMVGQRWNVSRIWNLFDRDSAQRMLSTYIPKEEKEDEVIWLQEENGDYSIKSGYWYLQRRGKSSNIDSKFLKRLWKMPMSQRWRTFCWKLAHDILPTKENLKKRKLLMNSSCVLCGENESAGHLFLYCEFSKRIWRCSTLGFGKGGGEEESQETGNHKEPHSDMWEHGIQQQCDYHLKIDGAWKQKENEGIRAAYGWVLERRHHVKRVGSGKIFALSPLRAEAHSLLEGITAVKAEADAVQISTDSKRLIQILRDPRSALVDCTHILSDILCILNLFSYCCIRKVHRLEIREAHNLAIQARREPY
ncbi:hypothetical protein RDABS01_010553 [Bienertia sinuspersici]